MDLRAVASWSEMCVALHLYLCAYRGKRNMKGIHTDIVIGYRIAIFYAVQEADTEYVKFIDCSHFSWT